MSNSQSDDNRHDRVIIHLGHGQYERLAGQLEGHGAVDDLMDAILTDESTWPAIAERIKGRRPVATPSYDSQRVEARADRPHVRCERLPDGPRCPISIVWRGHRRCGCPVASGE